MIVSLIAMKFRDDEHETFQTKRVMRKKICLRHFSPDRTKDRLFALYRFPETQPTP